MQNEVLVIESSGNSAIVLAALQAKYYLEEVDRLTCIS